MNYKVLREVTSSILERAHGDIIGAAKEIDSKYKRGVITAEQREEMYDLVACYNIWGRM